MQENPNITKINIKKPKTFVVGNRADASFSGAIAGANTKKTGDNEKCWTWGSDNQMPEALAIMARRSATHRRIINDKADYISGKGFTFDANVTALAELVKSANGTGESLRQVINKIAFDKCLFGNAFMEVITDEQNTFLSLYHHDASKCRLSKSKTHIVMHHDWRKFKAAESKKLPIFPMFEKAADNTSRSIIHYKDYEPMFENYGVPPYIAGMNVSTIAYKTDRWNISRLDNAFQLSGVMVLGADMDNEEDAANLIKTAETKFAGKPGQVMFLVKNDNSKDSSQFIPFSSGSEGDWQALHTQSTIDIVVAHSWFRSLSGMDYSSGFSSDKILQEYEVALNTIILAEQSEMLEPIRVLIREVLKTDDSSMVIINRPPAKVRPPYMKVWEARQADGLDYDRNDPDQNIYIAQISQKQNNE